MFSDFFAVSTTISSVYQKEFPDYMPTIFFVCLLALTVGTSLTSLVVSGFEK